VKRSGRHYFVLRNAISPLTVEVRDRAFHGPQLVIILDQIAQSGVNFQVGYKVRLPSIQAGNDCIQAPLNVNNGTLSSQCEPHLEEPSSVELTSVPRALNGACTY